ncbi:MAG: aminodeoxychorismate/anthranilate synthase component II [Hyphomicrobiaceae bacterium]|nr:aminodeoxychorismate/anthranilate synthase component II [Hyphomicrobiaceae bacterium]
MFLVIDNYDSFTYNLVHAIGALGAELSVVRNDKITLDEIAALKPEGIILSPGPCTPNEAGVCLSLLDRFSPTIPIFGVCLGMQAMGQIFGGAVVRAPYLMHGKLSTVLPKPRSVFRGINEPFAATRYHSLIVERASLPDSLDITAETEDGLIMGLAHRDYPVHGVQFHPESIASEYGERIFSNFLEIARSHNAKA